MYLSYERYAAMGGTMPEGAEYERAERKARALLDDWTLGRVKRLDAVPEEVELAMFEIIQSIDQATGGVGGITGNVGSFSNGVNSVSFTGASSASATRGELYDLVTAILPVELVSAAVSFDAC